jgi:hypothetical protein
MTSPASDPVDLMIRQVRARRADGRALHLIARDVFNERTSDAPLDDATLASLGHAGILAVRTEGAIFEYPLSDDATAAVLEGRFDPSTATDDDLTVLAFIGFLALTGESLAADDA